MTALIIRLFVKDRDKVKNPKVRERYGVVAGMVGIVLNILLTLFKIITGLVTGTMSIVADSINNLSDATSSIVTMVGFKMSGKPADKEHPYGHGRAEYIAGFVVAAAVIAIALELFKTSIGNIIKPSEMDVSIATIIILVVAICVKMWMFLFYGKISKIISSKAMRATALDSRNDCITTGVALASVIIKIAFDINIDGYACLIVSLFVIYAGIGSAVETIEPLLGEAPSDDVVESILTVAMSREEILGVHDLRIHEYGPSRMIASFHVEMSAELSLVDAHEVIDAVERELQNKEIVREVTIHIDPIVVDDEDLLELKDAVFSIVKGINDQADIHDFRMSTCLDEVKVFFDVMIPYGYETSDEAFKQDLLDKISSLRSDVVYDIAIDRG